jgi:hypothetical protein
MFIGIAVFAVVVIIIRCIKMDDGVGLKDYSND